MSEPFIISDSSPLISLERINRLDLLERLFETVVVPSAVAREIGPFTAGKARVAERRLRRPIEPRIVLANLGAGESEALSLSLEFGKTRVLVDDLPARILADALGIPISGTIGILLAAKRHGFIATIKPDLDALRSTGSRISPELYERSLALAEEKS